MPVWLFICVFFGLGTSVSVYLHFLQHGVINPLHIVLSFFLLINILICLWEMCLFFRIDHIKARNNGFDQTTPAGRIQPTVSLFTDKITFSNIVSPTFWSEVWAAYSVYDGSYADKRTFGFAADIGNGFFTLIPTLIFHTGMTYHVLPANVLGIIGLVIFYQMFYLTGLYWVSFFVNGRHKRLNRAELLTFIVGTNAPWFIVPALGLYAAITLIMNNSYALLL